VCVCVCVRMRGDLTAGYLESEAASDATHSGASQSKSVRDAMKQFSFLHLRGASLIEE